MDILNNDLLLKKYIDVLNFYRKKLVNKCCYSENLEICETFDSDGFDFIERNTLFYVKNIIYDKNFNKIKIFINSENKSINCIFFIFPNVACLKIMLNSIKVVKN